MTVPHWLIVVVALYFALNLYLTGRWADRLDGEAWWRQVVYHVGGILFFSGFALYDVVSYGARELATLFQVKTLWGLYVTGKHRDYTVEKLEYLNKYQDQSKTFRGRMFRFVVRLVNKANNYDPKRQSHSNAVA